MKINEKIPARKVIRYISQNSPNSCSGLKNISRGEVLPLKYSSMMNKKFNLKSANRTGTYASLDVSEAMS